MNIAVYCSSRNDLPQVYVNMAEMLGTWIGTNGHTLVYGGVNAGLMHITAQAVHDTGGKVLGVIPEFFMHRADVLNDELITTRDLNDRKSRMIAMADAFVILPGGIGTIDEWISTLSQLTICDNDNRGIIVANHEGMYDGTIRQLMDSGNSIFSRGKDLNRSIMVDDAAQLIEQLNKLQQEYGKK
ncbi:MAG: TIGR00730 family Rossman fold protein [Muribaculaceae bacterium]|nr:TIGR00730 family Rossman fold protein [Muribaculaceae bacterium]